MSLLAQLYVRRLFTLPHFEPTPLEFQEARDEPDELLLDEIVAMIEAPAPAPEPQAVPTAGELRESIERHLQGAGAETRRADAADELRNALAELRRSIG